MLPGALLFTAGAMAARGVVAARGELWRAACLELDDPRQRPRANVAGILIGPTATAVAKLARAVDAVRRGELVEANEVAQLIDRDLLLAGEARLLDAVRAMVSLGMGDDRSAAQQAILALPTGSVPFDGPLGRVAVAEAWGSAARLAEIDAAWEAQGVGGDPDSTLARLHRLVKLRLHGDMDLVSPDEARAIGDEARAIGDDRLAAELDARARSSTYR
jgi:hypothetical protein